MMFRSVISFTLPGVMVLLGWWWYAYRKKEQQTQAPQTETAIAERLTFLPDSTNPILTGTPILPTLSRDQDSVSALDSKSNQLDQEQEVCNIALGTDITEDISAATSPLAKDLDFVDGNQPVEQVEVAPVEDADLTVTTTVEQDVTSALEPVLLLEDMKYVHVPTTYTHSKRYFFPSSTTLESSEVLEESPVVLEESPVVLEEISQISTVSQPYVSTPLPGQIFESLEVLQESPILVEESPILVEESPILVEESPILEELKYVDHATPYPHTADVSQFTNRLWLHHEFNIDGPGNSPNEILRNDLALSTNSQIVATSDDNLRDTVFIVEMPNGCQSRQMSPSIQEDPLCCTAIETDNSECSTTNTDNDLDANLDHLEACGENGVALVDSGSAQGALDVQAATATPQDTVVWEIRVPKNLVGRLIGKQGRCVNFLKQNSGTKIFIRSVPYSQEFQICHIEGTVQQVDKVLSLIRKKFKDLDLSNMYISPTPPTLGMNAWLGLPTEVPVHVAVVNIVSAGQVFIQQHTHPTFYALESLEQEMLACYSQPYAPTLTSPVQSMICVAPGANQAWWRAQVISLDKEADEVRIRYLDNGGYVTVKTKELRKIRSDFVKLPFQSLEVILNSFTPFPGQEALDALAEMTEGVPLIAKSVGEDEHTSIPLVDLWNMEGEPFLINNVLVEKGHGSYSPSLDGL